jgi:hypothetical protein
MKKTMPVTLLEQPHWSTKSQVMAVAIRHTKARILVKSDTFMGALYGG